MAICPIIHSAVLNSRTQYGSSLSGIVATAYCPAHSRLGTKSSSANPFRPGHRGSDQELWRAIDELLDSHEYGTILVQIELAEQSFLEQGDNDVATSLAAAGQLCRICGQVQAEKVRHKAAALEARRRERELRRQLRAMIGSISQIQSASGFEKMPSPPLARTRGEEKKVSVVERLSAWLDSLRGSTVSEVPEYFPQTAETEEEGEIAVDRQADEQTSSKGEVDAERVRAPVDRNLPGLEGDEAQQEDALSSAARATDSGAEKSQVTEVALDEADRELLRGIHELLVSSRKSVAGVVDEELEPQTKVPQALELPLQSLEAQVPKSLLLETVQMRPVAKYDPDRPEAPLLMVYTLGPFRVIQNDQSIEEWYGIKGKSIFKYLISRPERSAAKEVLMELFWPGADPEAARNNLNVSIYSMRKALRHDEIEISHVLFQEDRYLLNPQLQIWLDFEAFSELYQEAGDFELRGQLHQATARYQAAELLYQGEFMAEDRYEDWLIPQRQRLRDIYMNLLDRLSQFYYDAGAFGMCVSYCRQMLVADSCHEAAHCQLMRCYYRQGQVFLAMRQYHQCVEALRGELDLEPTAETEELLRKIQRNEPL